MGVPAHPALFGTLLAHEAPFQVMWFFIFLLFPGTLPGLGGARGSLPSLPSLADPPGEMVDSSSTSERGRVLMLIQAAATAGSAAVRLTDKHTSPTQGLTFLGDYPVLTW